MPSIIILTTAVASLVGFALNSAVLYLVLSRGKQAYHYLFAGLLSSCVIWDFGVFLMMVRNIHVDEMVWYGYLVTIGTGFLPALIFQFTLEYLDKPKKRLSNAIWISCAILIILQVTGWGGRIEGVWQYAWGNMYKPDPGMMKFAPLIGLIYYFATLFSCWLFYQEIKIETDLIRRRHLKYILASFLAITVATVKILVVMGFDFPFVLPFGMLLNDLFVALIGVAIIKHQLFDITLIVKKGVLYSVLGALIIFILSFSEHILANYVGELLGHESTMIHLLSIAIVIAVLMPVKQRLEHSINRFFAQKKLEF